MFNKALFKLEWKTNYKILIIFCLILTMYTTIMISMYDPELGSALEVFFKKYARNYGNGRNEWYP